MQEEVYSKPFSGTKRKYLIVSTIIACYLGVSIFLMYGLSRYYLLGDTSTFSLKTVLWVCFGILLYIAYSYHQMKKVDGLFESGEDWVEKSVKVTLIEQKHHRPFG